MKYFKKSYFSYIKRYKNYTLLRQKNKSNKNTHISQKNNYRSFYIILPLLIIVIIGLYIIEHKFILRKKINKYFIPNTYRIAFVFGTRPEALKLFPLIKELKKNKNFTCIIINTGQHKEMLKQILDSINLDESIDFNLNLMKNNQ